MTTTRARTRATSHSLAKRERSRWSTPRRLVLLGSVAALLAAILGTVIANAASHASSEVDLLGSTTAPQVTVDTDLYLALSDLDAQAANALLVGNAPERGNAMRLYEQRRTQADADLRQAAIDAAGDTGSEKQIQTTIDWLGQYESLASQAFLVSQQGGDPAGHPSSAALALYRQATDVLHDSLDNVQQLTTESQGNLDDSYTQDSADSVTARVWIGVLGGLLVLVLIVIQIQLRLRLRRRLNPALVAGTVVALLLALLSLTALGGEANSLRAAKQDAFDSIAALSQARAVSYNANADESRYLLDPDPQRASRYEADFLTNVQALASFPGSDLPSYTAELSAAMQSYRRDKTAIDFAGYFATELRNITFPGERQAANDTLTAYQAYLDADQHLRAMAASGQVTGAIQFDIGTAQGDSDAAFGVYDNTLVKLIQINQNAFGDDIGTAQSGLSGWSLPLPLVAVLLIIGLLTLGLWPRVAEYR